MRRAAMVGQGIALWVVGVALGFYFGYAFRHAAREGAQRAAPRPTSAVPQASLFTPETYPAVDGSTSTIPLEQLVFFRTQGIPAALRKLPGPSAEYGVVPTLPLGSDNALLTEETMRRFYRRQFSGTHDAYVHLIDHRKKPGPVDARPTSPPSPVLSRNIADIILVARKPSPDEDKLAKALKVELDIRPVALDAFVFVNNVKNTVTAVTLDQIRDVYTGTTKNWKDLGGADQSIAAFSRDRNSGSQELMDSLVMQGKTMIHAPNMIMHTMIDVINNVAEDPTALSYSVYYYERVMARNSRVRQLAIDGISATAATIASRTYPLTTEVYVVTRTDAAPDSAAVRLRDWLLSPAGQQVVKESGYVPVN